MSKWTVAVCVFVTSFTSWSCKGGSEPAAEKASPVAETGADVTVEQAGDEITAARVEDDRVLPDRVAGVRPNVGDVTVHDSDIRPVNDLARLDADPLSLADDEIGVGAAHGNVYEGTGEFCG